MIVKKCRFYKGFQTLSLLKNRLEITFFQNILHHFSMISKLQDYHEIPLFCIWSVPSPTKKITGRCISG